MDKINPRIKLVQVPYNPMTNESEFNPKELMPFDSDASVSKFSTSSFHDKTHRR